MSDLSLQSVRLCVTPRRRRDETCHHIVLYNACFPPGGRWAQSSAVITETVTMFSPLGDLRHFADKLFLAGCLLLLSSQ